VPDDRARQVFLVTALSIVLAALMTAVWFRGAFLVPDPSTWVRGRLIASTYDPPDTAVELFHNQGDGQIFAHQAQDPFMRHPEAIRFGPSEEAYRLQRPLYGWLGWILSAGRPGTVAWALLWLTILSVGALGLVSALVSAHFGRSPLLGLLVLLAPGVLAELWRCGPEALGCALALGGFLLWRRAGRATWPAVACLALACLARETFVLFPLTMAAVEWWPSRARGRAFGLATAVRSRVVLAVVPYLAWVVFVHSVVGGWPRGTVAGRLTLVPFGGLVAVLGQMNDAALITLVLVLVPAALALARPGGDPALRVLVALHLVLAATCGTPVWGSWAAFGRVLLPLSVVSVLSLLSATTGRRATTMDHDGSTMEQCSDRRPGPSLTLPAPISSRTPTAG
jgi:hypothetical protein